MAVPNKRKANAAPLDSHRKAPKLTKSGDDRSVYEEEIDDDYGRHDSERMLSTTTSTSTTNAHDNDWVQKTKRKIAQDEQDLLDLLSARRTEVTASTASYTTALSSLFAQINSHLSRPRSSLKAKSHDHPALHPLHDHTSLVLSKAAEITALFKATESAIAQLTFPDSPATAFESDARALRSVLKAGYWVAKADLESVVGGTGGGRSVGTEKAGGKLGERVEGDVVKWKDLRRVGSGKEDEEGEGLGVVEDGSGIVHVLADLKRGVKRMVMKVPFAEEESG